MNFKQNGISASQAAWIVLLLAGMVMPRSFAQTSLPSDAQRSETGTESSSSISGLANPVPTSTELSVATDDSGPSTVAKFTVRVSGDTPSAQPQNRPAGVVTLNDADGTIGSAAVDADGLATFDVDGLRPGIHRVVATFSGTSSKGSSASPAVVVKAQASQLPDYAFALSPTSLTVKAGTDGTIIITVTPTNGFNQLVSLSCAGNGVPLPVGVSCLFTPVNLVPAAGAATLTSSLNIQTTGVAGKTALGPGMPGEHAGRFAYAILLPGILALAGLAIPSRRGVAAQRFSAVCRHMILPTLLLVSCMGLSSCAARYHYLHNPPAANNGTPLGTYTLVITASSSSNSSIIVHSQNIALTVK